MTEPTTDDRTRAWARLIWHSRLKTPPRITGLAIAELCEPGAASCSPTLGELCRFTGLGAGNVVRALHDLENLGYIEVERDPDFEDEYRLTFPIGDER